MAQIYFYYCVLPCTSLPEERGRKESGKVLYIEIHKKDKEVEAKEG